MSEEVSTILSEAVLVDHNNLPLVNDHHKNTFSNYKNDEYLPSLDNELTKPETSETNQVNVDNKPEESDDNYDPTKTSEDNDTKTSEEDNNNEIEEISQDAMTQAEAKDFEVEKIRYDDSDASDEYDPLNVFEETVDNNNKDDKLSDDSTGTSNTTTTTATTTPTAPPTLTTVPFLKHPLFSQLDELSKSVLIAEYAKNPSDEKFKIFENSSNNESKSESKESSNPFCKRPNLKIPLTEEEHEEYNKFINREIELTASGEIDQIPLGGRLFIGNLPTSSVSKQLLWRICKQYGEVLQINIRHNYGFCQFRNSEQCLDAIKGESGVPLHGQMLILQVSKNAKRINSKNSTSGFDEKNKNYDHENNSRTKRVRRFDPQDRTNNSFNNNNNVLKKPRHNALNRFNKKPVECQVFVQKTADQNVVNNLKEYLNNNGLSNHVTTIRSPHALPSLITDAGYGGVDGVVVVESDSSLNAQIFEKTEDGGIRFDEYQDISVAIVIELFLKAKQQRIRAIHIKEELALKNQKLNKTTNSSFEENRIDFNNRSPRNDYSNGVHPRSNRGVANPNAIPLGQRNPRFNNNNNNNNSNNNRAHPINNYSNNNMNQTPNPPQVNPDLINQLRGMDQNSLKSLLNMINPPQNGYQSPPPPPLPPQNSFNGSSSPPQFGYNNNGQYGNDQYGSNSNGQYGNSNNGQYGNNQYGGNQFPPNNSNQFVSSNDNQFVFPNNNQFPNSNNYQQQQQQQQPPPGQYFNQSAPSPYGNNNGSNPPGNTDPSNIHSLMETLKRLQNNN